MENGRKTQIQARRSGELAEEVPYLSQDINRLKEALACVLRVNQDLDLQVAVFKAYFGIDEKPRDLSKIARRHKITWQAAKQFRDENILLLNDPVWARDRSEWSKGN